ncbi:lysoplasmalogenase [Lysobacter auxotrophicus]|uniref:Lysoplasmalogenase n=1 Tax=Lysobacter auxotrophicus TaxID=2992573 RepID=A0ABM8DC27_9GAMM|nr:lysoplasmalogenase [Lysobacter auxotrophicus]BDU16139.1 lysoplasmalogenase [Lysobacter auxotrophicus]
MTRTPVALAVVVAATALLAIVGAYCPAMPWLHWVFKPLTTLLIAWSVWRLPSDAPRYRTWLLVGLALSTAGDVFLMLPVDAFVAGLASFLLAHLAYLLALRQRERFFAAAWPFVLYALVAGAVLAQLWPGLPGELRVPVIVYVIVLAAMAAQASAVWWRRRDGAALCGAWGGALFVLSDALLAWDRFVAPFAAASFAVLTSYWLAQRGLARSVPRTE